MQQFVTTILNGITMGAVYSAFALALVLIWRSTRIVNFAQAPMAMVTTYVAMNLIERGMNYWIAFIAALVAGSKAHREKLAEVASRIQDETDKLATH